MFDDTPHFCFESAVHGALFRKLFAGVIPPDHLWSPEALLGEPVPPVDIEGLLPADWEYDRSATARTLEWLRHALVLSADDVDFCFSLLPDTPKNARLRDLLNRYLSSSCANDRAARLWALAESWKNGEAATPRPGRWIFVRGEDPTFLFEELGRSLASVADVTEARVVEPWEIPVGSEGRRRALTVGGTDGAALDRLADRVAATCRRGVPPDRIWIGFQGSEAQRRYLRLALRHRNVGLREELPESEKAPALAPSAGSRWLAALRADTTVSLRERLALNHELMAQGAFRWEAPRITRWLDGEPKIPEALLARLRIHATASAAAPPPKAPGAGVALVPFPLFPPPADVTFFLFVDEDEAPLPRFESLLREGERERLASGGFPLPRVAQTKRRVASGREALLSPRHRRVVAFGLGRALKARESPRPGPGSERALPPDAVGTLSATQLETYSRCPARYFYSYRLGLRREDPAETSYPLLLGSVVHKALEKAFLRPESVTTESLEGSFEEALREIAPQVEAASALAVGLRQGFRSLVAKVPALESDLRRNLGPREVLALEADFRIHVDGVALRGKIDRVDRRPDGSLVVLDYKTGNVDFTPAHVERGENFQALLYWLAVEERFGAPVAGILFYDLKKGEVRRGILREQTVPPEGRKHFTRGHILSDDRVGALRDAGLTRLRDIAGQLRRGEYPARPSADVCGSCDYVALCREAVHHG